MSAIEDAAPSSPREHLDQSVHRFFATLESDRAYVVAALEAFAQAERDGQLRARLADSYVEFRDVVTSGARRSTTPSVKTPTSSGDVPSRAATVYASVLIAPVRRPSNPVVTRPGRSPNRRRSAHRVGHPVPDTRRDEDPSRLTNTQTANGPKRRQLLNAKPTHRLPVPTAFSALVWHLCGWYATSPETQVAGPPQALDLRIPIRS